MPINVAVLGGGIAGLTAAHELSDRGFTVTVFEASSTFGGKAKSFAAVGTGALHRVTMRDLCDRLRTEGPDEETQQWMGLHPRHDGAWPWNAYTPPQVMAAVEALALAAVGAPLPAEHGFHYFPAFYRHISNTLERIPTDTQSFRRPTVADNLVAGRRVLIARETPPQELDFIRTIQTRDDIRSLGRTLGQLGLHPSEIPVAIGKLIELWKADEATWEGKLERMTWWDFIDAENRSEAYQTYFANIGVRSTVAMDPRKASARTIGRVVLRLFSDIAISTAKSGAAAPDRFLNGPTEEAWISPWITHLRSQGVVFRNGHAVSTIGCVNGRVATVGFGNGSTIRFASDLTDPNRFHYCIVALPLEPLVKILENSPQLRTSSPPLRRLNELLEYNAWMVGLQFYLSSDVPISPGGIFLKDSPWAITLVSQTQFWKQKSFAYDRQQVRTVLSVIISNWNAPGDYHGTSAKGCNAEELKHEVWSELKAHFNDNPPFPGAKREVVLNDSDLVDWRVNNWDYQAQRWVNHEQLFINGVGSLKFRPSAATGVENLLLAADFARTSTDLTSMESANEAARLAVNALLTDANSPETPCRTWPFERAPGEAVGALGAILAELAVDTGVTFFRTSAAIAESFMGRWRIRL